ncbi:MAG: hypothetical protein V9E94_04890 [Microthrixaceae bacterium]
MTDPLITDGRTARRERNRAVVLDAVLDLFAEGGSPNPTPDQVAERSGCRCGRSTGTSTTARASCVRRWSTTSCG